MIHPKNYLEKYLLSPYQNLSKRLDWGKNTQTLFRGIASIGPLYALARAVSLITHILAGRWLGPSEYGTARLALATGDLFMIPLILSSSAMTKFTAMEKEFSGQAEVISTVLWLSIPWVLFCAGVLYLARFPAARELRLPVYLYEWALCYAIFRLGFIIVGNGVAGLQRFLVRGWMEAQNSIFQIALFALFYLAWTRNFKSLLAAGIAAYFLSCLIGFYLLRSWIKPTLSAPMIKHTLAYVGPTLAGWGALVAVEALPVFIISAHFSPREIGYYGAYWLMTCKVTLALSAVIGVVLGPLASEAKNQAAIWKKFFRHVFLFLALALIFLCAIEIIMLKILGSKYPIRLPWLLLFSTANVFYLWALLTSTLLVYKDTQGAWLGSGGFIIGGAVCLALSFWAIPRWGVPGAALSLIGLYGSAAAFNSFCGWRICREARS